MIKRIINHKSGLNKTFLINMLSTVMLQGISFFTVPIFSRLMGSEQYGLYALFNSWVAIFSIFLALNISAAIPSGMYKYKNEYFEFRNNAILYIILISVLISFACIILFPVFNLVVNYSFILYILLLLTSFSTIIINAFLSIFAYEKKAILKFIVSLILSFSVVVLSLIFIYINIFPQKFFSRIIGHLIPYTFVALTLIVYFLVIKRISFSFKYIGYCLKFGLPLIGHSLAGTLLAQSDKLMMNKMGLSLSNIGIYSLFFTFVSVLTMILYSFNTSFAPFYYEYLDLNDKSTMIHKSKNYIEVFTVICIGYILLSREVSYIIASEEYYSGINLIPIFSSSVFFIFMYHFPVNCEFFYSKTVFIAIGTVAATILNIILNYFFILRWGMYGAAIATMISHFFEFYFHYFIAKLIIKNGYYVTPKYFAISLLLFSVSILMFYFLKDHYLIRWGIGFLVGLFELYRIYKRQCFF